MISISELDLHDFQQKIDASVQLDPMDALDVTWHYPSAIAQGYLRWIDLRDGMTLEICDMRLKKQLLIYRAETPIDFVQFHFHLWGKHEDGQTMMGDREFNIRGSGLRLKDVLDAPEQRALEVTLFMSSELLRSFVRDESGQLPEMFQHLIRPVEQQSYARVGKLNPAIERVLWEILRCPFQGWHKRMFLEGKALEFVSLVLEQEQAIHGSLPVTKRMQAGTRDRLYYARELLLQNLHQPLTLEQLAQQAQLNESTLKKGFKQEFGMTVFDYLLEYRLEQARQMLERGTMQVSEAMMAVGLRNRSYFATAFRKKFGQNPKQYQQQFDDL
ncbi:helix-turn-helix transcriptional regulator [Myxacorys almedinensis]|uniref:Helix-turn-helix domain-containing protein n=1 Tax=Myxacorys almedinensis A TaxID=2690445 RepID=A0A8J7Z3J5_9CYAN|nr:helix-turn-helix domain-containing protein [Myxacorys almedinensis]NDJ17468.1 helix-turn-helix domain-containing protein [Myxacorys almedinensis A]